jgi:hypothetical protein
LEALVETLRSKNSDPRIPRPHVERNEDELCFEKATQALGALDWILVRIVSNVRARTATTLRRNLAQVGIEVPESVVKSPKWVRAFHGVLSVTNHKDGLVGLFCDRLLDLGYEQSAVQKAINYLRQDVATLSLDVQTAVARELRRDLELNGVRVPLSILASRAWRDVFARGKVRLPPCAASMVYCGVVDDTLFRPVQE